jgi:hypothetical protein
MSIEIPRMLAPYAGFEAFVSDAGQTVRSPISGDSQRDNRPGSRFGLNVQLPPMKSDDTARKLVALLNEGLEQGVIVHWPQIGFDAGAPGLVQINGANQLGTTLNVDGVGTGYSFRHGQFGNFTTSAGRLHLFQLRGDVHYGDGTAALPIFPMIRKSPNDNSAVDFTTVRLEGWLDDEARSWTVGRARSTGLSFAVTEK